MPTRRWPWVGSATLLIAAGLTTAAAAVLHWRPCRGSMTDGSILRGFDYGDGFSDACLRRMDSGLPFPYPPELAEQAPWASELGVLATVLTGLAWLTLVLGSDWAARTRAVAALPGLLTLALAGHAAMAVGRSDRPLDGPYGLWWLVETATVLAVVAILMWQPGVRWWPLLLVALGGTAFGLFHQLFDHVAMGTWSDANWDVPPGTGYLTAAGLVLAGGLVLTYAVRPDRWTRTPSPAQPRESQPA